MSNPTRFQQVQFGVVLIVVALLSLLFVFASSKVRGEYRDMVAEKLKDIVRVLVDDD